MKLKKVPVMDMSVAGYASCICVNSTCSTCGVINCWCGCQEDIAPEVSITSNRNATANDNARSSNINTYYASQNRH